jgi:uncharacterized delta-60 repeat protein
MPVRPLRALAALATCLSAVLAPAAALARPGDADPSFAGGRVLLALGATPASQSGVRVVAAPGGGVFVLASASRGRIVSPAVLRLKANGSLDPTFGDLGVVYPHVGVYDGAPSALVRTADGKLLVGATATNGARHVFAVVRLLPNGALDPSFGGVRLLRVGVRDADLRDLAVDAAGRIVVAGGAVDAQGHRVFAVARLLGSGALDPSFSGGIVLEEVGGAPGGATTVAVSPSGTIVAGGNVDRGSRVDVALLSLTAVGTPNGGFHGTGELTANIGGDADVSDIAVQPSGAVVVAVSRARTSPAALVGRYTAAGGFDPTFAGGSYRVLGFGPGASHATGVRLLTSGAATTGMLVSGYSDAATGGRIGFARLNGAGKVVYIATDGVAGARRSLGRALAVAPSGKAVVAGAAVVGAVTRVAAVRFLVSNGARDAAFAGGNAVIAPGDAFVHAATGPVAIVPVGHGRVLVAGNGRSAAPPGFMAARLAPNGAPDQTYGGLGRGASFAAVSGGVTARDAVLDARGRLVEAGGTATGRYVAAAFRPNGGLDTSFGTHGLASRAVGGGAAGPAPGAVAVVVRPGGGFLLVGNAPRGSGVGVGFLALTARGRLDTAFGSGSAVLPLGTAPRVRAAVVQPNGRIVILASTTVAGVPEAALLGLRSNGTVDPTFGAAGRSFTPLGAGGDVRDVAVRPDGRLVVAGRLVAGGVTRFALLGFSANGLPDPSLNGTGQVTTVVAASAGAVRVLVAPDSKLVVAGEAGGDLAVVRYLPNGAVDAGFGGAGGAARVPAPGTARVTAFARLPDGRLMLGYSSADAAVSAVRLLADRPFAATGAASRGEAFVTVRATVSAAFASEAIARVEFGATRHYGRVSSGVGIPADGSAHVVAIRVAGLRPNRRYHYRVQVLNGSGVTSGVDRTFRTGIAYPRARLAIPRSRALRAWRTLHGSAVDPAPSSGIRLVQVNVIRIRPDGKCAVFTGSRFPVEPCRRARRVFVRAALRGRSWLLRLRRLQPGVYSIRVRAVDGAGLRTRHFTTRVNAIEVRLR